jgi:hypothetical protein
MGIDVLPHRNALVVRKEVVDDDKTLTNAPIHSLPAPCLFL